MRVWLLAGLLWALVPQSAQAALDPRFGLALGGDFSYIMPGLGSGGHGPYTLAWCPSSGPCVTPELAIAGDLAATVQAHPGQQWTALNEPELTLTAAQYAPLWRTFYAAVKAADPNASVFFPGMGANNPAYLAFLPAVVAAGPTPDFFTFHAYPGVDGLGSCESPGVYQTGLTQSESLVRQFDTLTAQYSRPVWITEWGWIRNAPPTAPEANTPCVAAYITDFGAFLKTQPELSRYLYFPNSGSVASQPWCDHHYAAGFDPAWLCWSGGLVGANDQAWQCLRGGCTGIAPAGLRRGKYTGDLSKFVPGITGTLWN